MDIASLIGIIIGCTCLGIVFFEASHGNLVMFYSLEGVLMVGGGSISVIFMALPMERVKSAVGFFKRFMFHKGRSSVEVIKLMGTLADMARRDGFLALESEYKRVKEVDPFLASGIRMVIDGTSPTDVEATLRLEIMAMQERHKAGKKFFDLLKLYGPGWGLIGTLVGQVAMFGNLSGGDVGALGKSLAIAVCATMYGTVLCNAVAGPIGDKLAMRSGEEIQSREMMLQGILSIQGGDNPRITLDKMSAFLPGREKAKAAA
jgi:chemotaxis protein MotA